MKNSTVTVLVALLMSSGLAWAAGHPAPETQASETASAMSDGDVRKVDVENKKITLKHGPIDNLGMPGMTMVFRADAEVLSKVKPGDSVRFKADKVDGAIKVTALVGQ